MTLQTAWCEVEDLLQAAHFAEPSPGFGDRWLRRVRETRRLSHHRQTAAVLALSISGALAVLLALGPQVLESLRAPGQVATQLMRDVAYSFIQVQVAWRLGGMILRGLPQAVPPITMTGLGVAFALLAALWFASVIRFAFRGAVIRR
ncbi:MAG TPA: hypothetical protein VJ123_08185 [Anaerolineales bacterium]|nr:hypothetical protein [Anaerolineales bacterium]